MGINKIKRSLISIARNIPGKSIGRKIVVIECDDWGSIGMPSKQVYDKLLHAGLPVNENRYERNDTVENCDDLMALFNVLRKYTDKNGNHAVMTPFCNMANPDFEKIKAANYQKYHRETFIDTYERYSRGSQLMEAWQTGIKEGIFIPEYHGREHIATAYWLKSLRSKSEKLRMAFDHGFVGHSLEGTPAALKDFRPNFYISAQSEFQDLKQSIEEGADIFKHVFRMPAKVFNAPNGVFVPALNKSLIEKGIRFNAVPRKRLDRNADGEYVHKTYSTGERTEEGLVCYVRNGNFEPTDENYKGIDHVMNQINGAFICGKAAVIGTHRANFVGGINELNREKGLSELDKLLKQILIKWPKAEFMSSRHFAALL
ncbi:hypothetical protein [Pedobacter sp. ASV28]|uniref:hypothetical protein n=1 Tax=Pedobacter sp. ASV28 TaxID=2795123 RepID=UPI0018EBF0A7|nr:hypothetical protein [Pedobacter sp. ASV28]